MIFKASNISKSYGSLAALSEVDLVCQQGEICGLIGANGAGKSTLFRIILGLIKQDSGTVEIQSSSPKPIGGIIEKPALYEYLNARENIKVFSEIQGLKVSTKTFNELMQEVGLSPDRKDAVKNYSLGMKQRLGLAVALLNNPDCLVLDEPFSGLDPMGIYSFHSLIKKLSRENKITVLISSHIVGELADLCDTLYVLSNGRIIKSGFSAEIYNSSVSSYKLVGENFPDMRELNAMHPIKIQGGYLVQISRKEITGLLESLINKGTRITACVPQSDLKALFEDKT